MEKDKINEVDLVKPSEVIGRFKLSCNDIAEKLHKEPSKLKEEMVTIAILIYEARARGDERFEITFNEEGLPIVKGFK